MSNCRMGKQSSEEAARSFWAFEMIKNVRIFVSGKVLLDITAITSCARKLVYLVHEMAVTWVYWLYTIFYIEQVP